MLTEITVYLVVTAATFWTLWRTPTRGEHSIRAEILGCAILAILWPLFWSLALVAHVSRIVRAASR